MKTWADLYPFVLPAAPEAPNPTVDHALRLAAQEFCERTRAWDVWLAPQNTVLDDQDYSFTTEAGQDVVKLLQATLAGDALPVLSVNDLPADWKANPGALRGMFTQDRKTFWILPPPAAGIAVATRVALKPSHDATGISDELFAHYAQDIATGAKAHLLAIPRQPFTDIVLAEQARQIFDSRCFSVARQVEKSFSRTPRRTVARFF